MNHINEKTRVARSRHINSEPCERLFVFAVEETLPRLTWSLKVQPWMKCHGKIPSRRLALSKAHAAIAKGAHGLTSHAAIAKGAQHGVPLLPSPKVRVPMLPSFKQQPEFPCCHRQRCSSKPSGHHLVLHRHHLGHTQAALLAALLGWNPLPALAATSTSRHTHGTRSGFFFRSGLSWRRHFCSPIVS